MSNPLGKSIAIAALLGAIAASPVLLAHGGGMMMGDEEGKERQGMMTENGGMMGMMSQMQEMMKNCNAMMARMQPPRETSPTDGDTAGPKAAE